MQKQREDVPIAAIVHSLGLKSDLFLFKSEALLVFRRTLNHSRVKYFLHHNPECKLHSMNSCVNPTVHSRLKRGGGPTPTPTASEWVTLLPFFCPFWCLLDPLLSQMRSLVMGLRVCSWDGGCRLGGKGRERRASHPRGRKSLDQLKSWV